MKDQWCELIRISPRTSVPQEDGTGFSHLRNFYILGKKLVVLPKEKTESNLVRVFYYAKDESPASEADLENNWMREFPDLFLAEVGMRLAADLEDAGALRYFQAMREEARANYDEKVEEERHAADILTL